MKYYLGIDVGSTTVKLVLADEEKQIHYKSYRRHYAKTVETIQEELQSIGERFGEISVCVAFTGSGGMELAESCGIPFVQEVFATSCFIDAYYPNIDVAVELGGEDAKIIFFGANTEERMNGSCAGGTGAFIDQMATLLHVTNEELDTLSQTADAIYPIASRCGVFAKSDIQPLLNQGASKANIAASVYSAVVDQTIGGLAGGRPIAGNVLFLGGPLTFCKGLRDAFLKALPDITPVFLEDTEYFVAFGTAFFASQNRELVSVDALLERVIQAQHTMGAAMATAQPLFKNQAEYEAFTKRHSKADVARCSAPEQSRTIFLGIDAGSTTTKMVAINEGSELVFTAYSSNEGDPIQTVRGQLLDLYQACPNASIAHATVTGYGEDFIRTAFHADSGVVETVAHDTAACYFEPNVDFIIDIGGQDMKCFGIKNKTIDSIVLNEACSSGCGSFLQSFGQSMGLSVEEFARLALFAQSPVDLGSRCTVFMNSSVKQAQKNGASFDDIAAGLAISVVKNALFKVLRVNDPKQLGEKIVVQGGTFQNDAVLRAFERELGVNVIRPTISGLMGAFGAALLGKRYAEGKSQVLSPKALEAFTHTSTHTRCQGCQNHCALTVNRFADGTSYLSGNRCSKPTGNAHHTALPNLYEKKQAYLSQYFHRAGGDVTIGIPLVLNLYDTLPFWTTLFSTLGFSVRVSGFSTRETYRKGQHTIPSDTICYGAKLAHGHILQLIEAGVDAIFYPSMSYNFDEGGSNNHFHCPVVAYYPEVVAANVHELRSTPLLHDFVDMNSPMRLVKQFLKMVSPLDGSLTYAKTLSAVHTAQKEQERYRHAVQEMGAEALQYAKKNSLKTIVLAGRPYHIDPELNHGIDKLISSLGCVVLSEDALTVEAPTPVAGALNQWTYHNRMYQAAKAVGAMQNTELVQLVSFGCGLDAVTTDEIRELLEANDKLYTALKIDEINNLGAARIRIRSLIAAMEERSRKP